jgi:hypothetical protein
MLPVLKHTKEAEWSVPCSPSISYYVQFDHSKCFNLHISFVISLNLQWETEVCVHRYQNHNIDFLLIWGMYSNDTERRNCYFWVGMCKVCEGGGVCTHIPALWNEETIKTQWFSESYCRKLLHVNAVPGQPLKLCWKFAWHCWNHFQLVTLIVSLLRNFHGQYHDDGVGDSGIAITHRLKPYLLNDTVTLDCWVVMLKLG